MDKGTSHIRIGLLPVIVSEDCLASLSYSMCYDSPLGPTCYDQGSDFSGRLLTGYDYGTPQASSYISHGQSSQSAG